MRNLPTNVKVGLANIIFNLVKWFLTEQGLIDRVQKLKKSDGQSS